jgi:hypothetical protein
MPLSYTKPPEKLMLELIEVALHSGEFAELIRKINSFPDLFPRDETIEICAMLSTLPKGTAEGCRIPLEYARVRLASLRRQHLVRHLPTATELSPCEPISQLSRGSIIDRKLILLYAAVATALDEYRSLTGETTNDRALNEPYQAHPNLPETLDRARLEGDRLQEVLDTDLRTVSEFAVQDSNRVDNLKRHLNDAAALTRLSRTELRLPNLAASLYKGAINSLKNYPRIIVRSMEALTRGADIGEQLWAIWYEFKGRAAKELFDVTRKFARSVKQIFARIERDRTPKTKQKRRPKAQSGTDRGPYKLLLRARDIAGTHATIATRLAEQRISLQSMRNLDVPVSSEPSAVTAVWIEIITYDANEDAIDRALNAVRRDKVIEGTWRVERVE